MILALQVPLAANNIACKDFISSCLMLFICALESFSLWKLWL